MLEDILKTLVESRGQENQAQSASDPMTDLVGSLLGGSSTSQQTGAASQQPGLQGMMGLLETVMGGQGSSSAPSMNDPIMALLNPFIEPLAKKANISPELAGIVISFVVHKLLAHHPTSGRDSNSFNLEDALGQINKGNISSNLVRSSGMVNELSKKTGMDEAETEQALVEAFNLVGKSVAAMATKKGK